MWCKYRSATKRGVTPVSVPVGMNADQVVVHSHRAFGRFECVVLVPVERVVEQQLRMGDYLVRFHADAGFAGSTPTGPSPNVAEHPAVNLVRKPRS
jgi:hypothetical protein